MTYQNEIDTDMVKRLVQALETNEETAVTFRTKAGHERTMYCSRDISYIPESEHEGEFDFRLNNPSIIAVYDWDNSAWRSFRKDSIISFEVVVYAD